MPLYDLGQAYASAVNAGMEALKELYFTRPGVIV
jgi:hypothetical protein